MGTPDLSGMPLPSVWETLGYTVYFLWEFTVRFWPVVALGVGGRLLSWWLGRIVERRRARRWYRDSISERDVLLGTELLTRKSPQREIHNGFPPDWDTSSCTRIRSSP